MPTRALANDKLAEWRRRGWDVGIATGDLALRLDARVVVATLETQKGRLLRGEGPRLLVVDEYQMLADPVRGVNYELSMALAPPETQLLLLSGSVANPQDVVEWLRRIGRDAALISHKERPVPLTDVDLLALPEAGTGRIERLLAAADREGAAGRSGAGAGVRAAAERGRGAGAGIGGRAAAGCATGAFPGAGDARGRAPGEDAERARGVSSQRDELCGARGNRRAAGEERALAGGGGDDGPGGGDQFQHALGGGDGYALPGGKLRARGAAG